MRSMAVRPRSFSRFRCWAGDRSSSKTTVSASTARRQPGQLLRLALAQVGGRVGRSRRWTTRSITSAPAVSTSRASSSRPASVAAGRLAGEGHPDQHDALPERARDEGVGEGRVARGHAGPASSDHVGPTSTDRPAGRVGPASRMPSGAQRHLEGPAGVVDRDPVADQAPAAGRGGGGRAPVPQAGSPPPRAPTPAGPAGRGPGPTAMNSTLIPPGWAAWSSGPSRPRRRPPGRGRGAPGGGCPRRPSRARRSAELLGLVRPRRGRAHVDRGPVGPARRPAARSRRSARPAGVATVKRRRRHQAGVHRRLGQAAHAVAAHLGRPPSALRSSMDRSAPVPAGRPGSPRRRRRPKRRSHRARTSAGVQGPAPAGSTRTRKSLPAPWCLVSVQGSGRHGRRVSLGHQSLTGAGRPGRRARGAPASTPTGSSPGASHTIRGSRRNQAHCRRAKARVRRTASATRLGQGHPVLHVGQQLAVAEGLAGGAATGPPGRAARARTSSSRPAAIQASKRSAIRRSTAAGSNGSPTRVTGVGG